MTRKLTPAWTGFSIRLFGPEVSPLHFREVSETTQTLEMLLLVTRRGSPNLTLAFLH